MSEQGKKEPISIEEENEIKRMLERKMKLEENKKKKIEEEIELQERQKKLKEKEEELKTMTLKKKKGQGMSSYQIMFIVLSVIVLFAVYMLAFNKNIPLNVILTIDESEIEQFNIGSSWKRGSNSFFEGTSLADAKSLINTSFSSHSNLAKCKNTYDTNPIPDNYNFHIAQAKCAAKVANQQNYCGSGFAFAITQTISERICLNKKSKKYYYLSPQELLSCDKKNKGCKGGYINNSLLYINNKGILEESCFPYQADSETVSCKSKCKGGKRFKIKSFCVLNGEEEIKRDILKYGPVIVSMNIHVEFLTYKSGIYKFNEFSPKFSNSHAVKIVGWGKKGKKQKQVKYWIIQNSWGEDWGENGFAKVLIGQDLNIDNYAYSIDVNFK